VIVVERREEGHALLVQRLVYFISEVLSETSGGRRTKIQGGQKDHMRAMIF
jgi:hypothetical protein